MKKICKECGKEFNAKNKKQITCSRSCGSRHGRKKNWSDDAYINKMKDIHSSKEHRELMTKINNERMNDDEYKTKWLNAVHSEEAKKIKSIKMKERWCDDSFKEYMRNVQIELWKDLDFIKKHSIAMIKKWQEDGYKDKLSQLQKDGWTAEKRLKFSKYQANKWKDSTFARLQFASQMQYKNFTLPSGRIVKLQGYEPQILSDLLVKYDESDIIIGVKEMNDVIGEILYTYDNVERRYYPDFYIKSTNTIIEVKSTYTFELHKEKNLAKEQACLRQGFNFKFIVL